MKLTKKEAREATRAVWSALAKSGESGKDTVPFSKQYVHNCPCCQYCVNKLSIEEGERMQSRYYDCKDNCPAIELWMYTPHNKNIPTNFCAVCETRGTLYVKWNMSTLAYDRQFFATIIAESV